MVQLTSLLSVLYSTQLRLFMQKMIIPSVTNDGRGTSLFSTREIALHGEPLRMLSEQQDCVNFRLRHSTANYSSDWHVAGDPTLLVILKGTVAIILRDGTTKTFAAGELFIAEDYLLPEVVFDNAMHGHRAEVVGEEALSVLHLKLARLKTKSN